MPAIPEAWRALALEPPRATGPAPARAVLRVVPEDFVVDENLGFAPSGSGSHVLLHVRKRAANTEWVARSLARLAGCRPHDVGYAGLKDRHAVATQWFSVPGRRQPDGGWEGCREEGFEVLAAHAHQRKLPRGALAGNAFRIRLRALAGDREALEARLHAAGSAGAPNYFGPQRFGRDLSNLMRLADDAARPDAYVVSAGRALLFNAVCAARVARGTWCAVLPGEVANLDGASSLFPVQEPDAALAERVAALDVHPTGPLPGDPSRQDPRLVPAGAAGSLEARVLADFADVAMRLAHWGVAPDRRALRVAVRTLRWAFDGDTLELAFQLGKGSYATTVLREVLELEGPGQFVRDSST